MSGTDGPSQNPGTGNPESGVGTAAGASSGTVVPAGRKPRIEVLGGDEVSATQIDEPKSVGERVPATDRVHSADHAVQAGSPRIEGREVAGRSRIKTIFLALAVLTALAWAAIFFSSADDEPDAGPVDYTASPEGEEGPAEAELIEPLPETQAAETEAAPYFDGDQDRPRQEVEPPPTAPRLTEVEEAVEEPPRPRESSVGVRPDSSAAVRTVSAFYSALSRGDGASAAQFVVPGKRSSGPLSAGALSRYFSSFRRPLQLRSIAPVDADTVRVGYDYVLAGGRACNGRATIDLVESGGEILVSRIRTQGPC